MRPLSTALTGALGAPSSSTSCEGFAGAFAAASARRAVTCGGGGGLKPWVAAALDAPLPAPPAAVPAGEVADGVPAPALAAASAGVGAVAASGVGAVAVALVGVGARGTAPAVALEEPLADGVEGEDPAPVPAAAPSAVAPTPRATPRPLDPGARCAPAVGARPSTRPVSVPITERGKLAIRRARSSTDSTYSWEWL